MMSKRTPGQPHNLTAEECQRIQTVVLDMARDQVASMPALTAAFNMFEFGLVLAFGHPNLAQEALEAIMPLGVDRMENETASRYFRRCYRIRAAREERLGKMMERGRR